MSIKKINLVNYIILKKLINCFIMQKTVLIEQFIDFNQTKWQLLMR